MKYLRSYLLVPGAGGQILGSRSSGCHPLRCLTTAHRQNKVKGSNGTYECLPGKRQVSTDGAKNSQLAVVGQVAPALPPPSGDEIQTYSPLQPHNGAATCPRHDGVSYPRDQACPRHGNPCFSKQSPEPSYGLFLTEANSLKTSTDPISLEMVFLPTFHAFKNDIQGLFFASRPKSAGVPHTADLEPVPSSPEVVQTTDFDIVSVERSKSLEALLPTTEGPLTDDVFDVPARHVRREVVLPRTIEPLQTEPYSRFDAFMEVHSFQKRGPEGETDDIGEDICPPKFEDSPSAPGSFIIQNDRSSVIIHRDLYITNRILEKLKKMEEKQVITPDSPVKTSALKNLVDFENTGVAFVEGGPDSSALVGISKPPFATEQSAVVEKSSVTGGSVDSFIQREGSLCGEAHPKLSPKSSVSSESYEKSDSHLNNLEFKMPKDRVSAIEGMAMQARKNLYARMKNASSPCVLVDGVHVKHAQLEDVLPLGKGHTLSEKASEGGSNILSSGHTDLVPTDVRDSASAEAMPELNSSAARILDVPGISQLFQMDSAPPEIGCSIPPEPIVSLHTTPSLITSFQSHSEIESGFEGFELTHLTDFQDPHIFDPHAFLGEYVSDKLQSELEDWFIPLGTEIESMLLTLATSEKPHGTPEQNSPEQSSMFEEEISRVREFESIQSDDAHPFEGIEIIENALLSPRGHEPFGSGQSRDKNTTSTSLPPKSKNPNIDIKTETTIKCSRSGDNTDINVTETQRYLDKRLPYPFCTETVLQVYGTSDSLSKATQAVESSKAQLVHLHNANTPNPGMLTPKLQFNHMLSKSHDNSPRPNSKKTVLKIKVIPNTESPSSTFQSETQSPKSQPSHILQLTEQPAETSTDVSKLIRRSKFNPKNGPKKVRRGDSVMKLRPKKKFTKESSENIRILSPKELEKMFPSPPKPKPVEKPRKVTIETKMGKEAPNVVQTVKQSVLQGGIIPSQFRSSKVQDDILKKRDVSRPQTHVEVVTQPESEAQTAKTIDTKSKVETDAALSARDQKILQSLISNKVKDSFMAVAKKSVPSPNVAELSTNVSPKLVTPQKGEQRTIIGIAEQTEQAVKPASDTTRPKSPISQSVNSFSSAEVKTDVNKPHQIYQNDPKKVYATILETAKEKPKEKLPPKAPKPKAPRPVSPTPKPNREYINIKTVPPKSAGSHAALEKAPVVEKKKGNKADESVLPLSASTIIANVMKSSADMSQPESRWRHLDKTAIKQTANEHFPKEKTSVKSLLGEQRRPTSARSKSQPKPKEIKPEVRKEVRQSSPVKKKEEKDVGKVDDAILETLKEKRVWNLPTEPLFFPFETPNFKEILEKRPSESKPQPIPNEASHPKASADVYEVDFCKLRTEGTPGLVRSGTAKYRIPLDRMKDFPLVNPGKPNVYAVPSNPVSISPVHDLMMLRNLAQVPAVTKVLGATLSAKSQQALDRWKQGLIAALGEQGFQEFYQNQLKRGTEFHRAVRKFLVERLDGKDDLCMRSLSQVLPSVSDISVVESQVVHPLLGYRGVIDCVAKYKGKPVVIEWKRSDKSKPSLKHTYDAPLQLSAYFGALNFDNNYKDQQVEGGVVVVAYSDGSPADVFELPLEECERYWSKWLKRLHQYYGKSASSSA